MYHKLVSMVIATRNCLVFLISKFPSLPLGFALSFKLSSTCLPRSESESEEEVVPLLSEEEMNRLASELLKAEIRGKTVSRLSLCWYQFLLLPIEMTLSS